MPPRPPAPRPETKGGGLLALLFSGLVALIVIVISVMFSYGGFVPVIAGLFAVGLFHYLVWGWWLGKYIRDEADADEPEEGFWERPDDLP